MSDLKALPQVNQIAIQVKLDGFIEACFHVARAHNIGLRETTDLTICAVLRELTGPHVNVEAAMEIWLAAAKELLPPAPVDHANLNRPQGIKSTASGWLFSVRFFCMIFLPITDRSSSPAAVMSTVHREE